MILIIGVAHVLDVRDELSRRLRTFSPGAVAIELDPERFESLQRKAGPEGDDTTGIQKGPFILRLWANVQQRLASELGDVPGSEMLAAARSAKELGVPMYMVDDTMKQIAPRLLSQLSPRERVTLLVSSVLALFIPAKLVKRELEEYSKGNADYVGAMRQQFPTVARVLLDERNEHMAARLKALSDRYEKVAAIVGDAHTEGLVRILQGATEIETVHLLSVKQGPG